MCIIIQDKLPKNISIHFSEDTVKFLTGKFTTNTYKQFLKKNLQRTSLKNIPWVLLKIKSYRNLTKYLLKSFHIPFFQTIKNLLNFLNFSEDFLIFFFSIEIHYRIHLVTLLMILTKFELKRGFRQGFLNKLHRRFV